MIRVSKPTKKELVRTGTSTDAVRTFLNVGKTQDTFTVFGIIEVDAGEVAQIQLMHNGEIIRDTTLIENTKFKAEISRIEESESFSFSVMHNGEIITTGGFS